MTERIVGLALEFQNKTYQVSMKATDGSPYLVSKLEDEQLGQTIVVHVRKDKQTDQWEWWIQQEPIQINAENFGLVQLRSDHARNFACWLAQGVADKVHDLFGFLPAFDGSYDYDTMPKDIQAGMKTNIKPEDELEEADIRSLFPELD